VLGHLTDGLGKIEPLESLDAPLLELAEVTSQGILGDPRQPADLLVEQALAREVDRLHLLLHPGVRVVEALVMEGLDVLGDEADVDHRRDPAGSWVSCSGGCENR
jgi:hypothetical protein